MSGLPAVDVDEKVASGVAIRVGQLDRHLYLASVRRAGVAVWRMAVAGFVAFELNVVDVARQLPALGVGGGSELNGDRGGVRPGGQSPRFGAPGFTDHVIAVDPGLSGLDKLVTFGSSENAASSPE
jgi:hypothetical protein